MFQSLLFVHDVETNDLAPIAVFLCPLASRVFLDHFLFLFRWYIARSKERFMVVSVTVQLCFPLFFRQTFPRQSCGDSRNENWSTGGQCHVFIHTSANIVCLFVYYVFIQYVFDVACLLLSDWFSM